MGPVILEQILKYFWVVTILFLVTAAVLAARLTSDLIARSLWIADVGETAVAVVGATPLKRERLADYRVIQQRNLFNAHPKNPVLDPVERPPLDRSPFQPDPVPIPPLNLTLVGTVIVQDGQSLAVVELNNEIKVVRETQPVTEGAILLKVLSDRIRVKRGSAIDEFLLYPPDTGQARERRERVRREAPVTEPGAPEVSDTIRAVGEDQWLIDSREVEEATVNMSRLMTQIRVVPNFTDGQPDGFKVFAIRPGSLFAKIGLQNGDVIKRVNGVDISGPEQAFEAYQQLKDETEIQIDLTRRDENRSFRYEIR